MARWLLSCLWLRLDRWLLLCQGLRLDRWLLSCLWLRLDRSLLSCLWLRLGPWLRLGLGFRSVRLVPEFRPVRWLRSAPSPHGDRLSPPDPGLLLPLVFPGDQQYPDFPGVPEVPGDR